jgi:hypothetical protein
VDRTAAAEAGSGFCTASECGVLSVLEPDLGSKRNAGRLHWLVRVCRHCWHRLDHLDAAGVANVLQARRQWRVGDEGLDLADMGDANRGTAPQFGAVRHQHGAAGIGDDGLRRLHFAIVEIE